MSVLRHRGLVPAAAVERIISQPAPTGRVLRRRVRRSHFGERVVRLLNRAYGFAERRVVRKRVHCPVCGWTGLAFRADFRSGKVALGVRCPRCKSVERHRLFAIVWDGDHLPEGARLHFAPEQGLQSRVASGTGIYVTTDLDMDEVTLRSDAEALPLADRSIAVAVCNDVLEHVEHPSTVLGELLRVLTDDGRVYLHVPIVATSTVEYEFANALDHGHRRAFGPDVANLLTTAGILVDIRSSAQYATPVRRRLGLAEHDAMFIGSHSEAGP